MALNKTNLVEKQNILNEIRSNNMTVQELRFFSIYLSMINSRDTKSRVARFPIARFQKIMELGKARISYLKSTTDSLLCKLVHITLKSGGYESFQLFKKCKVDKDENGEWFVEIDAHDDALPHLFEYKTKYFTYQLWNALRLKSANQLRMYELLKQYEKIGERELKVEELRSLIGIAPSEYPRWERFRAKVIDVCQKALEEYTDIKFTYEPIKRGKGGKIVAIKFNIQKNTGYVDPLGLDEYYDLQSEPEIIIDVEYSDKTKEPEFEGQQAFEFENENLEFLSEACNNEFTEEQMDILKGYLVKLVPFESKTYQTDQYDYLLSKYKELNYAEKKKKEKGDKISDRFKYLTGILKIEVKKAGESNESKW
jgi:hypothetical protein